MTPDSFTVVDAHVHTGLVGDRWPHYGHMSQQYRESLAYKIFLFYAGLDEDIVCDRELRRRTVETVVRSGLDKVVLLALDPVFGENGMRQPGRSHVWVSNEYVGELCRSPEVQGRGLIGCSVHPYDPTFENRIRGQVEAGAVLVKWLPSAQQIDLASEAAGRAMKFLATAKDGRPLPLLLHIGPEYAIPSSDSRTQSYDYLSWSTWESFVNFWRFGSKWRTPAVDRIHQNLHAALEEGATIIFAHCGLPYFFSGLAGRLFEHDDFKAIRKYLKATAEDKFPGKCYTDVSALATPFRKRFFQKIEKLPPELVLYGSDFPTPVFEISADACEMIDDLRAILKGDLRRIIVPQDNLLDVNLRELRNAFPGHPMFYNFARRLLSNGG